MRITQVQNYETVSTLEDAGISPSISPRAPPLQFLTEYVDTPYLTAQSTSATKVVSTTVTWKRASESLTIPEIPLWDYPTIETELKAPSTTTRDASAYTVTTELTAPSTETRDAFISAAATKPTAPSVYTRDASGTIQRNPLIQLVRSVSLAHQPTTKTPEHQSPTRWSSHLKCQNSTC